MALNRWLAQRSEIELRRIVDEPTLWPGDTCTADHKRCIVATAEDAGPGWYGPSDAFVLDGVLFGPRKQSHDDATEFPFDSRTLSVEGRFDNLCARFSHVRITTLIQHSALRHLARLAEKKSEVACGVS